MNNLTFENVTLKKGFWLDRYNLNKNVSIDAVYNRFKETNRINALLFHYDKSEYLHVFYDSDTAKWIEAVSYLIIKDKSGYKNYEDVIDTIAESINKNSINGYIDSYFIQKDPAKIFVGVDNHELYCLGHMIEAGIAYDKATNKSLLLDCCKKAVDYVIDSFISKKNTGFHAPGHEEIELALIKLYYYTQDKKYLDLAIYFIDQRGKYDERLNATFSPYYNQNEKPLREMTEANGHAVRATYIYIAMVEAGLIVKDDQLLNATQKIFDNIVEKRMYITGGIGSSSIGECFTVDYDLPNLLAYSESCASIGLALFSLSMQKMGLNSKYAETIERVIYNSMLSSTSLSGEEFFYENPLAISLKEIGKDISIVENSRPHLPLIHRQKVFGCSCCPPNINRIFARIGDFIYSEYNDGIVINQFINSKYEEEGKTVELETDFPKNGKIRVLAQGYRSIYVRKPLWSDCIKSDQEYKEINGYLYFENISEVNIDFGMPIYFVEVNPNVKENIGKVALMRGPVVYCMEELDNVDSPLKMSVDTKTTFKEIFANNELPIIKCSGYKRVEFNGLYKKLKNEFEITELTFIPYYTFANRKECDMSVFINQKQ